MPVRTSVRLLFAVVLVLGSLPLLAAAQPTAQIEPELLARLRAEDHADFFVKMAAEADLSAAYGLDWDARGRYVVEALAEVAASTQAGVVTYAQKHGLAYRSYTINNSVEIVGGDLAAAQGLAALPGVAYVRGEHILTLSDPVGGLEAVRPGAAPEATTSWGILDTRADETWLLGVRGAGIKVASIDTGVQWNHPALANQFACPGAPSDSRCWYDPSNICGGSACDNTGHGTATMGVMVGEDNPGLPFIVGMAPDATWITCKGCETNACSDSALTACANWMLQPGGNSANRPHVVNNSWGSPAGGDPWYQGYVQAWRAAGIAPAFSAGSEYSCNTLGSPGDYQESLGSTAHDSSRTIYNPASRGPSTYGHEPYTKPNLSAPGVDVYSCWPTNAWVLASGTSLSSAHTAGAVALLWSACPSCVGDIDRTFELLQDNAGAPPAGNCGAPPDGEGNYTYGYGYLDVLAAVEAAAGPPAAPVLQAISNPDQDGNYTVDWNDVADATGYELQEDDNSGFSSPVLAYDGPNSQLALSGKGAGTWYYRVLAKNGSGDSPWSNTVSTTVAVSPPAAPTLLDISNADGDNDYLVDWTTSTGATSYTLQEDDASGFGSPTPVYQGPNSQLAVSGHAGGQWYYRVRASNSGGDSPWSNVESVGVRPLPPALSPISNPDGDGDYGVSWASAAGATEYRLEEDDQAGFGSPLVLYQGTLRTFQVTGRSDGTWYYRVRASNTWGTSLWSGIQSVRVGPVLPVYVPLLARNVFIDPYEPNDSFLEAWGPLVSGQTYHAYFPSENDDADYYYFEVPGVHNIEIWLTNIPPDNDYDLYLYDALPQYLTHSGGVGNMDEHIFLANRAAGKYYIRITREAGSSSEPYALRAVFK